MDERKTKQPYLVFSAIIIAGLMVAGAIAYKGGLANTNEQASSDNNVFKKQDGEKNTDAPKRKKEDINISGEGDDPVLGDPNAPVAMVIFGDFQCHFCRKLELEIKPKIIEKYVKTGKVKIIARDFPFLGKNSVLAAEAGNCALEQNKYWEFSSAIHQAQEDDEMPDVNSDAIKELTKKLKLSESKFNDCLDSNKYLNEVKKDFEDGRDLGVDGTPTTFINGEKVNGAVPFEEFEKIIDALI